MIDESTHVKFFTLTVRGRPVQWKAPFVGKRGAFSDPKYAEYKDKVNADAQYRMYLTGKKPSAARAAIRLRIFVSDNKEPDNTNVLKAIEDGLQGAVLENDKQIKAQETNFEFCEKGEDRVEIEIWIDAQGRSAKPEPKKIAKKTKKS